MKPRQADALTNGDTTKTEPVAEGSSTSKPTTTPRRGRKTAAEKEASLKVMAQCQELFDVLRQFKTADKRIPSETFLRAPSRRTDAEFYNIVERPIDMMRIQQKIKTEEYKDFAEVCADFELLFDNARKYYKETDQAGVDTAALWQLFCSARSAVESGGSATDVRKEMEAEDRGSVAESEDRDVEMEQAIQEELLRVLLESCDSDGRLLCPPFRILKSREEFPLYYERIERPIDIKMIAQRVRAGEYSTAAQMEQDVRLMIDNAHQFNDKNTQIYKDATVLWRVFQKRRNRLENTANPVSNEERREHAKSAIDVLLSMQSAGDDPIPGLSEDSEEDEDTESSKDALWQLYWHVRNEPSTSDDAALLCDPFLELPSKAYYPDYFDEIKTPMSFFMVNRRLKKGAYSTISDLVSDLVQIYDNACSYNLEGSDIYVAAWKLREITLRKAAQLDPKFSVKPFQRNHAQFRDDAEVGSEGASRSQRSQSPSGSPVAKKRKRERSSNNKTPRPTARPDIVGAPVESLIAPAPTPASWIHSPAVSDVERAWLMYRHHLVVIWDCAYNFRIVEHWPAGAFMELPSRREWPEYYEVIKRPICMRQIREKIDAHQYPSSTDLLADFTLLFKNAFTFNEPDSVICRDADRLQHVVQDYHSRIPNAPLYSPAVLEQRLRSGMALHPSAVSNNVVPHPSLLTPGPSAKTADEESVRSSSAQPASVSDAAAAKNDSAGQGTVDAKLNRLEKAGKLTEPQVQMFNVYKEVRDLHDASGRWISALFVKLPARTELPDYYEVIKRPMDLMRIATRLLADRYSTLAEFFSDLHLMTENAMRYNEPDSQVYKDAMALQRLVLKRRSEVVRGGVPSAQVELRLVLSNILAALYEIKDDAGRCLVDTLVQLPDLLRRRGVPDEEHPFSLDQIKRNIAKCRYRRLDRFQHDVFELCSTARNVAKLGSPLFEHTVQLQLAFIKERDDECRGYIQSPATRYNDNALMREVEAQRREKTVAEEAQEQEQVERAIDMAGEDGDVELEEVTVNGITFRSHSFALVAPKDKSSTDEKHVLRIEKLFRNDRGHELARGVWVYRPADTFHLATKKFYENEVFLTPWVGTVTCDRLVGKTLIVQTKTWLTHSIQGWDDANVLICDTRYLGRQLHFKKIKMWPYAEEEKDFVLVEREEPLAPKKVATDQLPGRAPVAEKEEPEGDADEKASVADSIDSSMEEEDDRLKDSNIVSLDMQRQEIAAPQFDTAEQDGEQPQDEKEKEEGGAMRDRRHYAQLADPRGHWLKLGDFVLVYANGKPHADVMRIHRLWKVAHSDRAFFSGPVFARSHELEQQSTDIFLKREVFAVEQPDLIRPLDHVQSRCSVLPVRDFQQLRNMEVPECDVFVLRSRVNGAGGTCHTSENNATAAASTVCSIFEPSHRQQKTDKDASTADDSATDTDDSSAMSFRFAKPVRKLREYKPSVGVLDDEFLIFRHEIQLDQEMSHLAVHDEVMTNGVCKSDSDVGCEDSRSSRPASSALPGLSIDADAADLIRRCQEEAKREAAAAVGSGGGGGGGISSSTNASTAGPATPAPSHSETDEPELISWLSHQPKLNAKSKSGYILFSAEIRKRIMQENPESGFGEVSKIVGIEWKKLSDEQKKQYEMRAEYIAAERAKQEVASPTLKQPAAGQIRIYQCKWQSCEWQFDSQDGLYEHLKIHHTSQIVVDGENQFVCLWQSCLKYRANGKPFPSLPRLHRHIKEKHLQSAARNIYAQQRSRYFFKYVVPPGGGVPESSGGGVGCPAQLITGGQLVQQPPLSASSAASTSVTPLSNGHGHPNGLIVQQQQQQSSTNGHVVHHQQQQPPLPPQQQQHHHAAYVQHHLQQQQQLLNGHSVPTTVIPGTAGPSSHPSHPQQQQQQPQHVLHQHGQPQPHPAHPQPGTSTAVPPQPANATPLPFQLQQQAIDPGRTVVQLRTGPPPEPVFVAVPNSIQARRVLHSDAYLRYVETISAAGPSSSAPQSNGGGKQRSLSKYERSLQLRSGGGARAARGVAAGWLRDAPPLAVDGARSGEEQLVGCLWRLRDQLLHSTLSIDRDVRLQQPQNGGGSHAPHYSHAAGSSHPQHQQHVMSSGMVSSQPSSSSQLAQRVQQNNHVATTAAPSTVAQ